MKLASRASRQQVSKRYSRSLIDFVIVLSFALFLINCGGGKSSSTNPPVPPSTKPSITSISPSSAISGSATFTLTINGQNFVSGAKLRWNGVDRAATFASQSQLRVDITPDDIALAGKATVQVINGPPKSESSNQVEFAINNPQPILLSLNPSTINTGSGATTVVLYGSGFLSTSSVQFGSSTRSGTLINSTRMTVVLTAADLLNARSVQVSVSNPSPGGGSSGQLTLNITVPVLSVLTKSLPAASPSKNYAYQLQAGNGSTPYSWEMASGALPVGLNLNSSGKIFGTPSTADIGKSFSFTAKVTDSVSSTASQPLNIQVRSNLGHNDTCSFASPISNGVIRASISPHGDIDVYSFHGSEGSLVSAEIRARRLDIYGDPSSTDIFLDSFLEILDGNCNRISYNDDLEPGVIPDSLISEYYLNATGTYYIRISDVRGDGRPDFVYELNLSGAD